MVAWWLYILAFLMGSIPCGWLVAKSRGIEIREHGSGNIGSTNVGRVLGRRWGMLCFAFDVLKGLVPVVVAGQMSGLLGSFAMSPGLAFSWLGVGVAAILGHMYCPWLGFKGGKGVATSLGVFLGFWPAVTVPMAAGFLLWLIVVGITRYVSVASILASATLPLGTFIAFILREPTHRVRGAVETAWPFLLVTAVIAAAIVYAHRGNISRLRAGTEPKVGQKKASDGTVDSSPSSPATT